MHGARRDRREVAILDDHWCDMGREPFQVGESLACDFGEPAGGSDRWAISTGCGGGHRSCSRGNRGSIVGVAIRCCLECGAGRSVVTPLMPLGARECYSFGGISMWIYDGEIEGKRTSVYTTGTTLGIGAISDSMRIPIDTP